MNKYKNANEAFHSCLNHIISFGKEFDNTLALFNVGFTIENPMDNSIVEMKDGYYDYKRNWKQEYAEAEWQWYLSGDNHIKTLGDIYGKVPEIWKRMADDRGYVNSNYGWQWKRQNQIDYVINLLKENPKTRRAAISIYDAKEHHEYKHDTPCTYAVQFTIIDGKLCMSVYMRSNDLWYGFCNDQYCFSKLQELVATETGLLIGSYYHFAHNLHLYDNIIEKL